MTDTFPLFRAWRASLSVRFAPKTAALFRYYVHRALADLPGHPLEISGIQVRRYLADLTPASAVQVRKALGDFFQYLHGRGLRIDNPLADLPPAKRPRNRIKRGLERDELIRLLVALTWLPPRRPWTGERVALLALGQALTGMRPGELLRLTTDRVHLNGATSHIEITETKTGDERIVPLSAAARTVFARLVEGRRGRVADFNTARYYELIHRAAVMAGLPPGKARPYALRHTAAGLMVDAGVHIRTVAEILGHRDLRATLGYTQPSDQAMRDAVERLAGDTKEES